MFYEGIGTVVKWNPPILLILLYPLEYIWQNQFVRKRTGTHTTFNRSRVRFHIVWKANKHSLWLQICLSSLHVKGPFALLVIIYICQLLRKCLSKVRSIQIQLNCSHWVGQWKIVPPVEHITMSAIVLGNNSNYTNCEDKGGFLSQPTNHRR